jgi:hypothetical protein
MGPDVLFLILLILGAVCFLAAAFGWRTANPASWPNLVALGLFCWILVDLIKTARAM